MTSWPLDCPLCTVKYSPGCYSRWRGGGASCSSPSSHCETCRSWRWRPPAWPGVCRSCCPGRWSPGRSSPGSPSASPSSASPGAETQWPPRSQLSCQIKTHSNIYIYWTLPRSPARCLNPAPPHWRLGKKYFYLMFSLTQFINWKCFWNI